MLATATAVQTDYASIPGANWSAIKHISVSPRMYRHRLANPEARKPAWVIGGAIHCAVLEPEQFAERYVVLDADTIKAVAPARSTKEGKVLVAEHPEWASSEMSPGDYQAACVALAFPGKQALTERQRAICEKAQDAIHGHRVARDLLRGGLAEEVVTWTDERTGLRCKGRLDYLRPDLVIDLKSSRDPAPSEFEKSATKYGYAAQVAFYQDGARAAKRITGDRRPCVIAVRTKDDFDVAAFEFSRETLDTGRRIYQSLLHRLAECTEADYWPGVAPELRTLNLPPWADAGIINTEPSEDI